MSMSEAGGLPDKTRERAGYVSILARDYRDQGLWDILISDVSIHQARYRGMELASELAFLVPEVLENPTAIFMGIRWDADENIAADVPSWLCYVGLPSCSFNASGKQLDPYNDMVYLVFVNAERVVYHYRWDKCCPDNPRLPLGHDDPEKPRFRERVL